MFLNKLKAPGICSKKLSFFVFITTMTLCTIVVRIQPLIGEKMLEPNLARLDGVWQPVSGTRFRFYVFSAWMERRTADAIRVIAATKTRGADRVVCRLWLPDNRTFLLDARVRAIRENRNLRYSASFVLCLLSDTALRPEDTVGSSVAVIAASAGDRPFTNLLVVKDTEPKVLIKDTLHVCVQPLYNLDRNNWIVEWFEMNRILGVTHFYMYNESIHSSRMNCVLNHYIKLGLVTMLPWYMPWRSGIEIRSENQYAAYNDCLYRSMTSADWLLLIDVDELILPRHSNSLPTILRNALATILQRKSKVPSSFLFRNSFFYLGWADDPKARMPLLTARKTRRCVYLYPSRLRSKYVVRPTDVVEVGSHYVWEGLTNGGAFTFRAEHALLHHYRVNCAEKQCLRNKWVVDRTAHKWSNELWSRVQKVQTFLNQSCS